jgi:lipopolysaccharide export system protein LptA
MRASRQKPAQVPVTMSHALTSLRRTCQSRALKLAAITGLAALAAVSAPLYGAPSDISEDIIYNSEGGGSIESIGDVRVTTLRVNVRIRQGLTEIFGDTARLEQNIDTGDLIRVTVEGSPARFVRAAPDDSLSITGHSTSIVYYNQVLENVTEPVSVVEFLGDANFNRGRTALQCSQIKHIVETGSTDSPGPCSGILAPATN